MPKSMTGYGRAEEVIHGRDITVEIKSVNSRYFEYSSRMPRSMSFLDEAIKKTISARVSRGKLEMHLTMQNLEEGETSVTANLPVARAYYEAITEICNDLRIENDTKGSALARFQDVFTLRRSETDEEQLRNDVLAVTEKALVNYNLMRSAEGEKLREDVLHKLATIEAMLANVEQGSAGRVQRYTERLAERLKEILEDRNIQEERILTEAAIFADKTAVDEETVRLKSHIQQFKDILGQEGALGRKLDFLTQEINRETNTIGSKCQELEITRMVVDMKAEIEKIREQIQNLE